MSSNSHNQRGDVNGNRDRPAGRRYPSYPEAHAGITSPRANEQSINTSAHQDSQTRSNGSVVRFAETPRGRVGQPLESPYVTPSRASFSDDDAEQHGQNSSFARSPVSTINGILNHYAGRMGRVEVLRVPRVPNNSPVRGAEGVDQYGNVYEPFDMAAVTQLRPSSDTGDRSSLYQPLVNGMSSQHDAANGTDNIDEEEEQTDQVAISQTLGAEVSDAQTSHGDQDWETTHSESSDEGIVMRSPTQGLFMRVEIDEPDYTAFDSLTSLNLHKGPVSNWDPLSLTMAAAETPKAEETAQNVPEAVRTQTPLVNPDDAILPAPVLPTAVYTPQIRKRAQDKATNETYELEFLKMSESSPFFYPKLANYALESLSRPPRRFPEAHLTIDKRVRLGTVDKELRKTQKRVGLVLIALGTSTYFVGGFVLINSMRKKGAVAQDAMFQLSYAYGEGAVGSVGEEEARMAALVEGMMSWVVMGGVVAVVAVLLWALVAGLRA